MSCGPTLPYSLKLNRVEDFSLGRILDRTISYIIRSELCFIQYWKHFDFSFDLFKVER
jgi:hypothetical protein